MGVRRILPKMRLRTKRADEGEDRFVLAARLALLAVLAAWLATGAPPGRRMAGLLAFVAFLILDLAYGVACRTWSADRRLRWAMLGADSFVLYAWGIAGGYESGPVVAGAFSVAALYGFHLRGRGFVAAGAAAAVILVWREWAAGNAFEGFLTGGLAITVSAMAGAISARQQRLRLEARKMANRQRATAGRLRHAQTRVEALQKELLEVERLATVGQLSAEIAHQVRDPLSAMSLVVEMLQEEVDRLDGVDKGAVEEFLRLMDQQVSAVVELTDNYLQFARLPAPWCRPEDLGRLVAEVLRSCNPLLQGKHIELGRGFDPEGPLACADRRQVKYVVRNLMRNLLESMDGHGRLKVTTRSVAGTVEIAVADTGAGIAPERRRHMFEPFYSTKEGGTGSGLCLAERIVRRYGGRILCRSLPGVGTTFRVQLPGHRGTADARGNC